MQKLKVLITVKTYPIPSAKYDELVCTAGVTESGDFIRLYPIRFRDLPYSQQYKKYQWVEVLAEKHTGRDVRKESFRPNEDSLKILGEPIGTQRGWAERAKYALAKRAKSMEELYDQQKADGTSLGVIRPKRFLDIDISADDSAWKPQFLVALRQKRLWDDRTATQEPPRKVPWKFHYRFTCDDPRCNGNHRMMIEDWELGALYWRCIDNGDSPKNAALKVKKKFFHEMCADTRDTHLFVGTVLEHGTWVVIGVFWPPKDHSCATGATLFDSPGS
ncbi:MAG: hypothetical protein JNK25_11160 [Phycisphaerae bacterium]|nr:hypothetical protein [Phycisphaerae bacterium]